MRFTKVLLLGIGVSVFASQAYAQNASLRQEIEALKEDVMILQRQSYREKGKSLNPASAQDMAIRMGEFDETLRQAVGKMDEMEYKIKKLNERLDVINKDIDLRLKLIEEKGSAPADSVSTPSSSKASAVIVKTPSSQSSETKKSNDATTKTAEMVYQEGLDAIKANDNDKAIERFNVILNKFPSHKLAGNAQYWLGEAYYAKKDYAKAAIAFAKGYEKYKSGTKGADNILKLGMSMRELGKKEEACTAFLNLPKEFPKAEAPLKNKAKAAADALKCK